MIPVIFGVGEKDDGTYELVFCRHNAPDKATDRSGSRLFPSLVAVNEAFERCDVALHFNEAVVLPEPWYVTVSQLRALGFDVRDVPY